jgi:hypothetical protein
VLRGFVITAALMLAGCVCESLPDAIYAGDDGGAGGGAAAGGGSALGGGSAQGGGGAVGGGAATGGGSAVGGGAAMGGGSATGGGSAMGGGSATGGGGASCPEQGAADLIWSQCLNGIMTVPTNGQATLNANNGNALSVSCPAGEGSMPESEPHGRASLSGATATDGFVFGCVQYGPLQSRVGNTSFLRILTFSGHVIVDAYLDQDGQLGVFSEPGVVGMEGVDALTLGLIGNTSLHCLEVRWVRDQYLSIRLDGSGPGPVNFTGQTSGDGLPDHIVVGIDHADWMGSPGLSLTATDWVFFDNASATF